jgi:hypothetical protein
MDNMRESLFSKRISPSSKEILMGSPKDIGNRIGAVDFGISSELADDMESLRAEYWF